LSFTFILQSINLCFLFLSFFYCRCTTPTEDLGRPIIKPTPYGPTTGKVDITPPTKGPLPKSYKVTCVKKDDPAATPLEFNVPADGSGIGYQDVQGLTPDTTYIVKTTGLDGTGKPVTLESLPAE
jgi:hypothetical protein